MERPQPRANKKKEKRMSKNKENKTNKLKESVETVNQKPTIKLLSETFKISKEHPTKKNILYVKLNIIHALEECRISTANDMEGFRFRDHETTIVVTELIKTASEFGQNRLKEIKNERNN
jgi:hypothetical protein